MRETVAVQQDATPALQGAPAEPLLRVEDLHVEFETAAGTLKAVESVSFSVAPGETVAIVGESGSGKSVSALAIMRLLPKRNARVPRGRILFDGRNLLDLDDTAMQKIRGHRISMIFQEPMTSLNPMMTIGYQLMEPLIIHLGLSGRDARARAEELLALVGISDPPTRLKQYPHEFSGGMRQRVMIAIGLACNPKLIIADEPTTALDVTIQAQILALMKRLSRELGIALILITHNLGIVARYADRVNVMYAGKLAETGSAEEIFHRPRHPYTMGLLHSVPRLDEDKKHKLATISGLPPNLLKAPAGCRFAERCPHALPACGAPTALQATQGGGESACHRLAEIEAGGLPWPEQDAAPANADDPGEAPVLLEVTGLQKTYGAVRAVNGVSFAIHKGETLGLVGESGCGKSTVGRIILGLTDPDTGRIAYAGTDIGNLRGRALGRVRQKLQVIFQDPFSSLNPRMTVGQIIAEPLAYYRLRPDRRARAERVAELLEQVGLPPQFAQRYPHQLSGGQRQRIGIARALAMEPDCIVCDEAVSALDVSIQGQIINLLEHLRETLGIAYLFIAHDLAVVRHISHRVAVMYLGEIVEIGTRDAIFDAPAHPYTRLLLEAVPIPDPMVEQRRHADTIKGEISAPLVNTKGCRFAPRCPLADEACRLSSPRLADDGQGRQVACFKV
ncbi:MAG: dipeptide ABC transporter ATP-binding protein [Rhodobacter sp.]|uniref:dipeptide ABC transporter ATP-binding protein n=1 Tax=Pararhodobacter sp. TaxID=2127056 RepID=UPI001D6A2584|nr:dipeptide ABC transporter ATP-binding protein [Pararhodobacter sp.]MCB1344026.1 dipeptide ABC transporter ATP-binding protein [Paracoccaceae bacterium]MCC0074917.1 dipeptide ABC transporter ATP-binding protein [Rhodobacter sp.]HPD91379.1 dipeptide ABC transporter ATP-binding protein [Pararhodobacter sp.]